MPLRKSDFSNKREVRRIRRGFSGGIKKHAFEVTPRLNFYDGVAAFLLILSPLAGFFLFGGTRLWSAGGLMVFCFLGIAMVALRPFFFRHCRIALIPPGLMVGLVVVLYLLLRVHWKSAVPYEARFEFLKWTSFFGAYWAWTNLSAMRTRWRLVWGLLIFVVTLIAWYVLIQHANGSRLVLNLERPEQYGMRASGTYICPNHFANLLQVLSCMSIALLFLPSAGVVARLLAGYGLCLFIPCLYLTQSRSGAIGAAVGIFISVSMIAWRKGKKIFLIAIGAVPTILAIVFVVLLAVSPMVQERVAEMKDDVRLQIWPDTLRLIQDRPVWGHGSGSYRWVLPPFETHEKQNWIRYAHNEYLHAVSELGVVGFLLIVCAGGVLVVRFLRAFFRVGRDRDAIIVAGFLGALAATLAHAVFDFNLHVYANVQVLCLLGGTVAGQLFNVGEWEGRSLPGRKWLYISIGLIMLSLLLSLASVQMVAAYGLTWMGDRKREALQEEEAATWYERALRVDSGYWLAHLGKGHVHRTHSFWYLDETSRDEEAAKAIQSFNTALELNPQDTEILLALSRVYWNRDQQEKALKWLQEAAKRNPKDAFYLTQWGIKLRLAGKYRKAYEVLSEAYEYDRDSRILQVNLGMLERRFAAEEKADAVEIPQE